uniref:Uncharacterized protein n=1 Tax=Hanusia phi TaxID=3032 RepID=A0A7S0E9I8_9CRYP
MERHVREQNDMNNKMKKEINKLSSEAENEKKVIKDLINQGMLDITDKIQLLKNAAAANVTAVEELLRRIESEQRQKQQEQDNAIQLLAKKHKELQESATKKFQNIDGQVSAAEKALKEAETKVASERSDVQNLIMQRIQSDISGLDNEMRTRLESEKGKINSVINAGLKELDGNISDYSLRTGVKVAQLMSRVTNLKEKQKQIADDQQNQILGIESSQKSFKQNTLDTLEKLRTAVENTRQKLEDAEKALRDEENLRKQVEAKQMQGETSKLNDAVTQELTQSESEIGRQIKNDKNWLQGTLKGVDDEMDYNVKDVHSRLAQLKGQTAAENTAQQAKLQEVSSLASKYFSKAESELSQLQTNVSSVAKQIQDQSEDARHQLELRVKELKVELVQKVRKLKEAVSRSLFAAELAMQENVTRAENSLHSQISEEMSNADKLTNDVSRELERTVDAQSKAVKYNKEQFDKLSVRIQSMQNYTAEDLKQLESQVKKSAETVQKARHQLDNNGALVEAKLRTELQQALELIRLNISISLSTSKTAINTQFAEGKAKVQDEIKDVQDSTYTSLQSYKEALRLLSQDVRENSYATDRTIRSAMDKQSSFQQKSETALAKVRQSLEQTQKSLKKANEDFAAKLRVRASELQGEIDKKFQEAQRHVDEKLSREAQLLQNAHTALQEAIDAHEEATAMKEEEREKKLKDLSEDLQTLHAAMMQLEKMQGVGSQSSRSQGGGEQRDIRRKEAMRRLYSKHAGRH